MNETRRIHFVCNRCHGRVANATDDGEPFCPKCGIWMRDVWHGETPLQKETIAEAVAGRIHASLIEQLNRSISNAIMGQALTGSVMPKSFLPSISIPIGVEPLT